MTFLSPALAEKFANEISRAALPVVHIHGIGGRRWVRNVPPSDSRYGPWLQASYRVLNSTLWGERAPCLYLVVGARDKLIRYVGISRNRLRDRWRESPAIDLQTGRQIEHQLFHSQCWKHIEAEFQRAGTSEYEVRCIPGARLKSVVEQLGPPLSGFAALGDDAEGLVASVERWMCNNKSARLVSWNVAMTGTGPRSAR